MRKADLTKNHDWFEQEIIVYTNFLTRVRNPELVKKGFLDKYDRYGIIESSIIHICAIWESFVEEELIDCLNLDCSKLAGYLRLDLPRDMNRDLCSAILIGDRYLDFGIDNIKRRADQVLCDVNNPFKLMNKDTYDKIREVYTIRNYLSHLSRKSRLALLQTYKKSYGLSRLVRPGEFLLSNKAERLIAYIESFLRASQQMRGIIT
jgi:hypothetical protein